jgi:hypothetical protein
MDELKNRRMAKNKLNNENIIINPFELFSAFSVFSG